MKRIILVATIIWAWLLSGCTGYRVVSVRGHQAGDYRPMVYDRWGPAGDPVIHQEFSGFLKGAAAGKINSKIY